MNMNESHWNVNYPYYLHCGDIRKLASVLEDFLFSLRRDVTFSEVKAKEVNKVCGFEIFDHFLVNST